MKTAIRDLVRVFLKLTVIFVSIAMFPVAIYKLAEASPPGPPAPPKETYRLVNALGNSESLIASGLAEWDCQSRKAELNAVWKGLASMTSGKGSASCLPESIFHP